MKKGGDGIIRKIVAGVLLAGLAAACSGCVAIAAAGGAVAWQGGKVISEERVDRDRAVRAVEAAFISSNIKLTEKVTKTRATQIRGEYPDGANASVDVIPVGPRNCRIEIRVGIGQKPPARELLDKIRSRM